HSALPWARQVAQPVARAVGEVCQEAQERRTCSLSSVARQLLSSRVSLCRSTWFPTTRYWIASPTPAGSPLGPSLGPTAHSRREVVPMEGRDDGLLCRLGLANPSPSSQFQSQACCQLHQGAKNWSQVPRHQATRNPSSHSLLVASHAKIAPPSELG